uniref:NTP-PPase-like protein n=1 Tax=Siphoviridae sp. ctulf7 TaxID=2826505 RepID=A0A8S5M500_9CAUD|nr:MAG TPA: NTP-PPase-like protein [Siphoviridae sp. ctulf7]
MEECAELIQAISKSIRYEWNDEYAGTFNSNKDNLIEEMADVMICIQILQSAYDIEDKDLNNMIQIKEDRLRFRYDLKEGK